MRILAIETSCDETAVSLIEADGNTNEATYTLLGDALYSQADKHAEYGGVYPTLAKREHQKNLVPLTTETLKQAGMFLTSPAPNNVPDGALESIREEEFKTAVEVFLKETKRPDIDLIAVTKGPGLEPALWTGITFAQALSTAWDIPLFGADHMEGHIVSALVEKTSDTTFTLSATKLPVLSLLISGGHTELILMNNWFEYKLVGKTRDDAVGEAFDKVARLLDLPYPGGPHIATHALRARERGGENPITLPRPMMHEPSCDFSFSGLKTAVLYSVRDMGELKEEDKENIAAAFEDAVRDVLVQKTKRALDACDACTLVVGGGVAANGYIRESIETLLTEYPDTKLHYPGKGMTGDNAIMIGIAAHLRHSSGKTDTKKDIAAHGAQTLSH